MWSVREGFTEEEVIEQSLGGREVSLLARMRMARLCKMHKTVRDIWGTSSRAGSLLSRALGDGQ